MRSAAELERVARIAEAERDAAKADLAATRDAAESPVAKARRLTETAAEARKTADLARRRWYRRTAWIWARLAILAALLWGAWRIGFESGYLAGKFH